MFKVSAPLRIVFKTIGKVVIFKTDSYDDNPTNHQKTVIVYQF